MAVRPGDVPGHSFFNSAFVLYRGADEPLYLSVPGPHRPRSGFDLIREVKKFLPLLKIVVLTGYGSIATATEAVKLGAHYYLPKPADVDDILNAFEKDSDLPGAPGQAEFEVPSLARAEWEHIQRVLNDCDNNITAAAHKLGIHRRTLQRKLYKYAPQK